MNYLNLNNYIAVCETLNIHKAAEILQVSPQYLSRYISELEKYYQVTLFNRTPKLSLTLEGEMLLTAAKDIERLEYNLKSELNDLSPVDEGEICLGYCNRNIRMFLPDLLSSYCANHKHVSFTFKEEEEDVLRKMTIDGQLDFYMGIRLSPDPNIEQIALKQESIQLLVPDNLLKKFFPNDYPLCAERFNHGVYLRDFLHLPLMNNLSDEFLYNAVQNYALTQHIDLSFVFASKSTEALLSLCRSGFGCLCVSAWNNDLVSSVYNESNYIYSFPILDLNCDYQFDIAYPQNRRLAQYATDFIVSVCQFFAKK